MIIPIGLVAIGQMLMAMVFVVQSRYVQPTLAAQLRYQIWVIPIFIIGNTLVGLGYNLGGHETVPVPFIWLMVIGYLGGSIAGFFGGWAMLKQKPSLRIVAGLIVALGGIIIMNA